MTKAADHHLPPGTTGLILHKAAAYDLAVWLMTFGRERVLREKILRLARLEPGEAVLDVGCGTGSLALAAKRQVGSTGRVHGIDASAEMIGRAGRKANKARLDVVFRQAAAQELPFPDAQFDVALSTIMLHHLPRKARAECLREMRRVLKPGGRALAVDFAAPARRAKSSLVHFHRHGGMDLDDIVRLVSEASLTVVASGPVGFGNLHFALGTAPSAPAPSNQRVL